MEKYYFNKRISGNFQESIKKVEDALQVEGFGVISRIDLKEKFKEKLKVAFRNYIILGACNPAFAYEALKAEDKIGTLLPCNIIVQELDERVIDIAIVNPLVSMQAVKNPELESIANEVSNKLKRALEVIM